ncbi:STAS domain-containing protein [Domibacillus sp. PGB-M46]|uniref:STAS domain-containing protein n=1 Tax=Domibacillus sp. PGB-M46 TaxID=2910255 RepID=UPI001F55E6F3|nr:STAS domain-containing protein [Domibacillus sp. PGB-M46]MCI2255739.1 STAS domain-containing protein [Domibacillus sp. PGB-M46]
MEKPNLRIRVNKNEIVWNEERGLFTFDGAPALLLWDSAVELFLNTIEEVSGTEVSKAVYEATFYRMGHLVSSYYQESKDIEQLLAEYSDIYKTAGWGSFTIAYYSFEEKRAVVQLKDSWAQRIFKNPNRKNTEVLLPSHWSGVFAGLFQQDMWYKVNKSQAEGEEFDEIEITPSSITPSKNIHELARQKEQQSIKELEEKVEERTEELSALVKELSSPIIPVLKGILVIPLIGKYNQERISDLLENALIEISRQKANYLLIDVTAINSVDEFTMFGIQKLIESVRLLGAECFMVGISSKFAIEITNTKLKMSEVRTFSTLQKGVEAAIELSGFELLEKKK